MYNRVQIEDVKFEYSECPFKRIEFFRANCITELADPFGRLLNEGCDQQFV